MKVSVIIPTYNEQDVIEDCLNSLLEQNYEDFEIIVVDDGSTDNTLSILKRFSDSKVKIELIEQTHKGAGAARNLATKNAKGEILVFVDADMTFDVDFISQLIKPIENGEAIGTFSKDEHLLNKNNPWARAWNLNRGLPESRMHNKDYPDTQKVFRAIFASEFKKAGGFSEKAGYTDDWSLSEKLGIEAVLAPGAVFYHKNPASLYEVFIQSRWMAKRKYKLGLIGILFALLRVSFLSSIVVGILKSVKLKMPQFFLFKIVSDLGQFFGILEHAVFGGVAK